MVAPTDPPETMAITREITGRCVMAGVRPPTPEDVAQFLANAKGKGLRRVDWTWDFVQWMLRDKIFEGRKPKRVEAQGPAPYPIDGKTWADRQAEREVASRPRPPSMPMALGATLALEALSGKGPSLAAAGGSGRDRSQVGPSEPDRESTRLKGAQWLAEQAELEKSGGGHG